MRKASRIELHDRMVVIGAGVDGGIYSDKGEEITFSTELEDVLLAWIRDWSQFDSKRKLVLGDIAVLRQYEWVHVDIVGLRAHVVAANLLEIEIDHGKEGEISWEQKVTYSGSFSVEWDS